ncbi:MAG: MetQ/NlpA family ABC transporter substrate-binding protein [Synergistaceae bacterium]|nr:MetQ/NlpA family ABC transporter substrate-binding protein [Synergistaceae bacterium]
MKKIIFALLFALVIPTAAFAANKTITIGVTPFPHKDIMVVVKGLLAKEGYDLQIKEFTDYVTPNIALAEKSLDANFFQHVPYLENMNREKNLNLVWVAKVHIEPLGLYSQKIKKLNELKNGAQIAIPNDATNCARALRLLEKNGLIKVKQGELVTAKDITDNPRKIKFRELDAAQLPRTLQDVDAAVINTNFAVEAKLIPSKDAIIIEGKDSPYANVIAVRAADRNTPAIKALVKAANSKEVKEYIIKNLVPKGIVPAF